MYCKLNENCIQFDALGVHMVGNPNSHVLFGLDEEGYDLILRLFNGCELDINSLGVSQLELLNALKESGLINDDLETEHNRTAYLHITSHCNMNCVGCYSRFTRDDHSPDVMQTDDILRIVDKLCEAKVSSIVISGGEPFLRTDIIDILRYIKNKNEIKHVSCISNGKINVRRYQQTSTYIDCLSFSLDGYSKEASFLRKESFDNVIEAINLLKGTYGSLEIIFTIHRKNYMYTREMAELAQILGVEHSFSLFTTAHSDETAELEISEDILESFIQYAIQNNMHITDTPLDRSLGCSVCCGAGRSLISISADGEIMPCHMFYDKKFSLGNALHDDISQIFRSRTMPFFSVDKKTKCKNCEVKYLCGGGCLFRSYLASGNLEDTDPLCPMYFQGIEDTVRMLIG